MAKARKTKVFLTDRAVADLLEIEAYSTEKWGKATAERYLDAFDNFFALVEAQPGILLSIPLIESLLTHSVEKHVVVCRFPFAFDLSNPTGLACGSLGFSLQGRPKRGFWGIVFGSEKPKLPQGKPAGFMASLHDGRFDSLIAIDQQARISLSLRSTVATAQPILVAISVLVWPSSRRQAID
jgi:plasmid stabilization system protein ParE